MDYNMVIILISAACVAFNLIYLIKLNNFKIKNTNIGLAINAGFMTLLWLIWLLAKQYIMTAIFAVVAIAEIAIVAHKIKTDKNKK